MPPQLMILLKRLVHQQGHKMRLTTLEEVKCLLGEQTNDFDADLDSRIITISGRANGLASRNFEQNTYVEIHNGGETKIYVDNPPIVSISEIVWDDFGDFANGFVIPTVDYFIVNRGWDIAYSSGPFPGGDSALRVTYIGGFLDADDASSTLPAELTGAIAEQVVYEFRRRKDTGLTEVSMPDGSINKITEREFLPRVRDVLLHTRIRKIG